MGGDLAVRILPQYQKGCKWLTLRAFAVFCSQNSCLGSLSLVARPAVVEFGLIHANVLRK